jgi:F-type H+-transporting ATPase subunit delta
MAGARKSTARRYAEAIFEIADRDGNVERWLEELQTVAAAVSDESVVRGLEDPNVAIERRLAALQGAVGAGMVPQMNNLLALIVRRRRIEMLPQIAREFKRLYNKGAGIVEATAFSATPLDEGELAALRSRLEQMTGGRIELGTAVDPSLLGGVQVRVGDMLIDGSVRGRLERLRNRLVSGALTP